MDSYILAYDGEYSYAPVNSKFTENTRRLYKFIETFLKVVLEFMELCSYEYKIKIFQWTKRLSYFQ